MTTELEIGLYIFFLAGFLGYHLITKIPPLLHTPLMSATNWASSPSRARPPMSSAGSSSPTAC
jgi:H+-translocating NAD(P) transhydrogenase subunit alpha